MAGLRKASAYSKKWVRPFTRKSGTKSKSYIKTVPPNKIVKFNMGEQKAYQQGKHKFAVSFIATERAQVRDNALEAARLLLNKVLDGKIQGQYYFSVKVFPHHILRENKTAAGAGADRLSSGMKHSFGVNIGRAAIVNPGGVLFFISAQNERAARVARSVLNSVRTKIPCRGRVIMEKIGK
jgi:large subunit ribosomal protein L10e